MVSALPLKKLSQSTAAAALGVAMLAAVGTAPASAVSLQNFKIDGTLGAGGTYHGNYTVDVDKLPTTTAVVLSDWNLSLKDNTQTIFKTFLKAQNQIGAIFGKDFGITDDNDKPLDGLLFADTVNASQFILAFEGGFKGTGPVVGGTFFAPNTPQISGATGQSVPEPFTIGASAVAGAMGLFLKRKQKASQAA